MISFIKKSFLKSIIIFLLITSIVLIVLLGSNKIQTKTSHNNYCMSCHVHPHAEIAWRKSIHFTNRTGVQVNCVDCHLPPVEGWFYFQEKIKTGMRDIWSMHFKDPNSIDWEAKRSMEHAGKIVYDASCVRCHQNLFPMNLNDKGIKAHLHYQKHTEDLSCVYCHLSVGHTYNELSSSKANESLVTPKEVYKNSTPISTFENFTERIPGTTSSFEMIAIPAGSFYMGSDINEAFRKDDEGPKRKVHIKNFYLSKTEVSWDEYWSFYHETKTNDRSNIVQIQNQESGVDGITGPTPPYGNPDQGWGQGKHPAISMTWYAATVYCQWLSNKTGKKYRLPTEAEWEYACRGNSTSPYFFEGKPQSFSEQGFWRKFFDADTCTINSYAVYKLNAARTQAPSKLANPFGLVNMIGNVAEFCSDTYQANAYSLSDSVVYNPTGPIQGNERVIRGGSFRSDAAELRSAARDFTQTDRWLKSDPQYPKSIWWYSDCFHVGFRVVCEQ